MHFFHTEDARRGKGFVMKKSKDKGVLRNILPGYAYLPLAAVLFMNFLAYYGTRLFTTKMHHYDLSFAIDEKIPFLPCFILIYVLAFVQWVAGYVIIVRESKSLCYEILAGDLIAKFFCMVIFLLLPTTMARPEVAGTDVFSWIVRMIYQSDAADNLFPSIHCLESTICLIGALRVKKIGKGYAWFSAVFTILVCLSTLFVKQHVVIDVIGGVAAAGIGCLITHILGVGKAAR